MEAEAAATLPASRLEAHPVLHIAQRRMRQQIRLHMLSCFRLSLLAILAALIAGQAFTLGRFSPAPWPRPATAQIGVRQDAA